LVKQTEGKGTKRNYDDYLILDEPVVAQFGQGITKKEVKPDDNLKTRKQNRNKFNQRGYDKDKVISKNTKNFMLNKIVNRIKFEGNEIIEEENKMADEYSDSDNDNQDESDSQDVNVDMRDMNGLSIAEENNKNSLSRKESNRSQVSHKSKNKSKNKKETDET